MSRVSGASASPAVRRSSCIGCANSSQNFAAGARRDLESIKDKLQTIELGQEIAAGMQVLDTSGHTAGHICVELSAGREGVVVLSDALTHPIISFEHPDWMPSADHHDPQRAAAVRKTVIGFHLPFPGIGIAERSGSSYRFVPV